MTNPASPRVGNAKIKICTAYSSHEGFGRRNMLDKETRANVKIMTRYAFQKNFFMNGIGKKENK